MNQTRGLALRCDPGGAIVEVIHNSPGLGVHAEVGMSFARLAVGGSLSKALSFLLEIKQNGATFDWEINVVSKNGYKTLRFVGGRVDDQLLIVGSEEVDVARKLYEELISMGNEQANILRAAVKQSANENNFYDEISRLNNELVTLQRQLAKQNAELERLYTEAQKMAMFDSLTDVYNRRGFFEMGEREVLRATRFNRPLSAILFDVDHFKQFNDSYGHAVGDLVLQQTAARCSESLRKVDIFGRYGGEEFAILLPETDLENALKVAERLRVAASQPIQKDETDLRVTISLGASVRDGTTVALDELLRRADQALYAAKEAGRNCVRSASA